MFVCFVKYSSAINLIYSKQLVIKYSTVLDSKDSFLALVANIRLRQKYLIVTTLINNFFTIYRLS